MPRWLQTPRAWELRLALCTADRSLEFVPSRSGAGGLPLEPLKMSAGVDRTACQSARCCSRAARIDITTGPVHHKLGKGRHRDQERSAHETHRGSPVSTTPKSAD